MTIKVTEGFGQWAWVFPTPCLGPLVEDLCPLVANFWGFEVCPVTATVPFHPSRVLIQARFVPEPFLSVEDGGRGEAVQAEVFSFPFSGPFPSLPFRGLHLVLGLLNFCLKWLKPLPDFFTLFPSLFPLVTEDSLCSSSRGTCRGSRKFAFSSPFYSLCPPGWGFYSAVAGPLSRVTRREGCSLRRFLPV